MSRHLWKRTAVWTSEYSVVMKDWVNMAQRI